MTGEPTTPAAASLPPTGSGELTQTSVTPTPHLSYPNDQAVATQPAGSSPPLPFPAEAFQPPLAAPAPPTFAPGSTPDNLDNPANRRLVDSYVGSLMRIYDIPGAAVGIIEDGRLVYTQGYGVRDTITQLPVTVNTEFPIGSLTKSFTALAALQLVQAGKLDLDAPVVRYLPQLKLADPLSTHQVTLRHFLTHTSGLKRSDTTLFSLTDPRQVLDSLATLPLNGPPGQHWEYSNQGYAVVGAVIATVSGQSWADYMSQHILTPLAMSQTTLDLPTLLHQNEYARPHLLELPAGMQPLTFADCQGVAPACGISASVNDLSRYAQWQLGDGKIALSPAANPDNNGQVLLEPNLFETMHHSQVALADFGFYQKVGYAYGWYSVNYRGQPALTHTGTTNGVYATTMLLPSVKGSVVLLTNAPDSPTTEGFGYALSLGLADHLLGLPAQPQLIQQINQKLGGQLAEADIRREIAQTNLTKPAAATSSDDYNSYVGLYESYRGAGSSSSANDSLSVEVGSDGRLYLEFNPLTATARPVADGSSSTTVNGASSQLPRVYELIPVAKDQPGRFVAPAFGYDRQDFELRVVKDKVVLYEAGTAIGQKSLLVGINLYSDSAGQFQIKLPGSVKVVQQAEVGIIYLDPPDGGSVSIGTLSRSQLQEETSTSPAMLTQLLLNRYSVVAANSPSQTPALTTLPAPVRRQKLKSEDAQEWTVDTYNFEAQEPALSVTLATLERSGKVCFILGQNLATKTESLELAVAKLVENSSLRQNS